jgi:hypothetical protein
MKLSLHREIPKISVRSNKRLLGRVAGVVLPAEHTEAESKDLSLPAVNDLTERLWIGTDRQFD